MTLMPPEERLNKVTAVAFSPNNKRLAVVTLDRCAAGNPTHAHPLVPRPPTLVGAVHLHFAFLARGCEYDEQETLYLEVPYELTACDGRRALD